MLSIHFDDDDDDDDDDDGDYNFSSALESSPFKGYILYFSCSRWFFFQKWRALSTWPIKYTNCTSTEK